MALLPAAIGVAIVIGTTVPLEFAAGACLAILASIKLAAAGAGILAALRARRAQSNHLALPISRRRGLRHEGGEMNEEGSPGRHPGGDDGAGVGNDRVRWPDPTLLLNDLNVHNRR
jgi:hypothetical protein